MKICVHAVVATLAWSAFLSLGARAADVTILGDRARGSDRAFPAGASPGTISLWFVRPPSVEDTVLLVYGAPRFTL